MRMRNPEDLLIRSVRAGMVSDFQPYATTPDQSVGDRAQIAVHARAAQGDAAHEVDVLAEQVGRLRPRARAARSIGRR